MSIRIFKCTTLRLWAALLLVVVLAQTPAWAQSSDSGLIATQQQLISELSTRTTELEKQVRANTENDAVLLELRLELEDLARELLQAGVAFRPRLNEINARLESLGPPPAEGQPAEAEIVVNERQSLANEKNEINVLIGDAESASIRANRLMTEIGDIRRDLFTSNLSKRYEINYTLLGEVAAEFKNEMSDLYRSVSSWVTFALKFRLSSVLAAAFFAVASALLILIGGRRLIGGLIYKDPLESDPSYLARLSVAFWTTLLRTVSVGVFLLVTWFFFDYFSVLRGDIGQMLAALFKIVALVYFVHRLSRSVFSPNLPNWQLISVEPGPARLLVWLATATALATGIDFLLSEIFKVQSAPVTVSVGESLVATVVVGLLVLLIARVKPFRDSQGRPLAWPLWMRLALYVVGGATIVAALLGYIGLAKFVSQQIVITGAILATMYIGVLSARAISEVGAFGGTLLGRSLGRRFHVDDAGFDQLGLVTGILINVLVVLAGVPLILLQWDFKWGDIRSAAYSFATEIKIGTVSFSLIGILTGVLVFALGYLATRWFQRWLDGSVMARGRVDAGVRNSIKTAVGYAGVALAGLIGVSVAGINLSSLALVAGALSLGIGFGLQNVVSNFVSGLILLAERPFKVGDWIVAGAVSGTVKRISVRATEIETFQRQTVIMPNSELINSAVGNWTHKNKLGRVDIKVVVAYGSDVKRAYDIMLDIAKSHPLVLKNPEPFVLFANFGKDGMDFEVRVFLADVLSGSIVQNDVRFAVVEAFDASGIDISPLTRVGEPKVPESGQTIADSEISGPPAASRGRKRPRKPDPD